MKFRKKPDEIEAFQMTEERRKDNHDWPFWLHQAWNVPRGAPGSLYPTEPGTGSGTLSIATLKGERCVPFGDWIIRGIGGELSTCNRTSSRRPMIQCDCDDRVHAGVNRMPMPNVSLPDDSPLVAVLVERTKQDAKWGEQNHNEPEWTTILAERVNEVAQCVSKISIGPSTPDEINRYTKRLEDELIQVATVAVAWIEAIRRR